MADFLSTAWIDALDAAVQASTTITTTTQGHHLVIQQSVTDTPAGTVQWHLVVSDGSVRVLPGAAEAPDVTFRQDFVTAVAVGSGAENAQTAFMTGRLHIGGTVGRLIEHRALFEDIDELFSDVYETTTFPAVPHRA